MKKSLIFAAIAAVVLSACAKFETFQSTDVDNAVRFGVYAGKMVPTRVTGLTTATLTTFGVYSSYTTADWTTSDKMNFMFDQSVSGSKAGGFTYSPVKYWPNETTDKLSFWAYAPYKDANNGITECTTNATAGYPKITYTMPAAAYQVDLLWATPVMNKVNNSAYTSGTANPSAGDATVANKVSFTFKHALALLDVQARYLVDVVNSGEDTGSALPAATVVKINEITLAGSFPASGDLNLNDGTWSNQASPSDASFNYDFDTPKNVTNANASILADTEQIMVIPKASGTTTLTLTVDYDVITTDAAVSGGTVTVNNVLTSSGELTIVGGKKYAVVAVLGLTSLKLDLTEVSEWGAIQATEEIDLPLND